MKIENRNNWFYKNFRRFVCGPFLNLFYNFTVEGIENLPVEGPAFILSKHQYWQDLFVICYISPVHLYYVAKYELFQNIFGDLKKGILFEIGKRMEPFITKCLCWMGAIPLNRENPKATITSFKYMEKLLNEGEIIVFFPEGHFVKNAMGEIKGGLIKWMMKFQKKKDIKLPVTLIGMNYKKKFPRIELSCKISKVRFHENNDEMIADIITTIKELSNLD